MEETGPETIPWPVSLLFQEAVGEQCKSDVQISWLSRGCVVKISNFATDNMADVNINRT